MDNPLRYGLDQFWVASPPLPFVQYPDKQYHKMVLIPNHFHGIIEISEINAGGVGMLDDHVCATDANNERETYAHGCVIDANERKINAHNGRTTETNDRRETDVRDQHTSGRPRRGALIGRINQIIRTPTSYAFVYGHYSPIFKSTPMNQTNMKPRSSEAIASNEYILAGCACIAEFD